MESLTSPSMDEELKRLADKVWLKFLETAPNMRCLVFIAGIPGSGKTTLSKRLTAALNARYSAEHPDKPPVAIFVPMDGFHYTRAQLDAMPDPALAHARRGAEFTFDGEAFHGLVRRLREPLKAGDDDGDEKKTPPPTIFAPSFDHAIKDPKENDIAIQPTHRLVILEGNYLLLSTPPWSRAAAHADLRVFVSAPASVARERLVTRHLAAGIADTEEEAERRAAENDLPNGEHILRSLRPEDVDEMVKSWEDDGWCSDRE